MKWVENGAEGKRFVCNKEKPNIFLIGDSIRKGYCETVKECLDGKAEVFFLEDNCRSSQYLIFNMRNWSLEFDDPNAVDIVHFNCGQWDIAHWNAHDLPLTSESEYERNMQIVVDLIRKSFPRARLIFATTSPMNPVDISGINPRTTEAVDAYNAIAVRVMERNGIDVNDVREFMRDWPESCYIDNCHLTEEAFKRLGEYVACRIDEYL